MQTAPAGMEADEGGLSDVNGRMSGGAVSFLVFGVDLTEEARDDVALARNGTALHGAGSARMI